MLINSPPPWTLAPHCLFLGSCWLPWQCLACTSFKLALVQSCPWLSSPFLPSHVMGGMVLAVILVSFRPALLL